MVNQGWPLAVFAALLLSASRHPTHTSSAELVQERDSVQVAIRVFPDDIAAVGPLHSYLGDRFRLVNRSGDVVRLEWIGSEMTGEALTIRMRGLVAGGLAGAKVSDQILTDRFADQVNVVRAVYDGRAATLIFTREDGPKALP